MPMHMPPGRLLGLAGGFTVVAALAVAPTTAGALSPAPGVTVSSSDVPREVERLAAADVVWSKHFIAWEDLSPTPGQFRQPGSEGAQVLGWLRADLAAAKAQGLRTYLTIENAPEWASGRAGSNDPPTPGNLGAYAAFLQGLAAEVGPLVDAWAPWNEPNIELFWAQPNAAAYVALQRTAYGALKAADPSSIVTSAPIAGVSANDRPFPNDIPSYTFLRAAYKNGLRGSIDKLTWNGYPPTTPEARLTQPNGLPAANALYAQREVDRILRTYDPKRKVWIGEYGWSTCVGCPAANRASRTNQAKYLTRSFLYMRRYSTRTEALMWFKLLDGPNRSLWQDNHGLLNGDFSAKPSYRALANLQSGLRPTRSAMRLGQPTSRKLSAGTLALAPLRLSYSWGQIQVRTRIATPGPAQIQVQGWKDGRWSRINSTGVRRTSNISVRVNDTGYLALRVLIKRSGSGSWQVGRVVRPKGALAPR